MGQLLSSNPPVDRPFAGIAGLAALLLVAGGARADDTHYRAIPIGAHAIGLGGAFTGVADDASAAYFNPAGLALGGTRGLAGGLSINAWERLELNDAYEQPDGSTSPTVKQNRTVPLFIGAVVKFGPKDALEQKRFALGISVVEPIFGAGGIFLTLKTDPLALSDSYRANSSDRATWYGLSFASRLDLKQSIGASMYLSVRKLNHSETGLTLDGGTPVPGQPGDFVGLNSVANTQSLNFKAFHFVLRFGWLYRLKPQLQLGVMVQTPGIPLKQKVNTFSQGFVNVAGEPNTPTITHAYFVDEENKANLPIPAEIAVGLEYWPAEKVMLSFDGTIDFPVRSQARVESAEPVPIGGLYFDDDTARRFIGNVALAGEFNFTKKVMMMAGLFTDLSSALAVPENPLRYYNPQINRIGATLSLGLNVAGVALSVGSTFLYGKGDSTGVTIDPGTLAVDYARAEAISRVFYLFVTGATRAAADLGDKSSQALKKRLAEKKAKEEAEEAERMKREAEQSEQSGEPADAD